MYSFFKKTVSQGLVLGLPIRQGPWKAICAVIHSLIADEQNFELVEEVNVQDMGFKLHAGLYHYTDAVHSLVF